jgi:hypothetical protein
MSKREKLLMAAVAGISMGLTAPTQGEETKDEVKCYGINGCGSHASCAVKDEDLSAFRALLGKDYAAKFGKSEAHGCGAHAKCGASSQILNWTTTSRSECKAQSGYVLDETAGKKVAKKA